MSFKHSEREKKNQFDCDNFTRDSRNTTCCNFEPSRIINDCCITYITYFVLYRNSGISSVSYRIFFKRRKPWNTFSRCIFEEECFGRLERFGVTLKHDAALLSKSKQSDKKMHNLTCTRRRNFIRSRKQTSLWGEIPETQCHDASLKKNVFEDLKDSESLWNMTPRFCRNRNKVTRKCIT